MCSPIEQYQKVEDYFNAGDSNSDGRYESYIAVHNVSRRKFLVTKYNLRIICSMMQDKQKKDLCRRMKFIYNNYKLFRCECVCFQPNGNIKSITKDRIGQCITYFYVVEPLPMVTLADYATENIIDKSVLLEKLPNLLSTLSQLHSVGFPYMNLSPFTIIVDELFWLRPPAICPYDSPKKAFAPAPSISRREYRSVNEARFYRAPEWNAVPMFPESDCWSLGTMLGEYLIFGGPMFGAISISDQLVRTQMIMGPAPQFLNWPPPPKSQTASLPPLLADLLSYDPRKRPLICVHVAKQIMQFISEYEPQVEEEEEEEEDRISDDFEEEDYKESGSDEETPEKDDDLKSYSSRSYESRPSVTLSSSQSDQQSDTPRSNSRTSSRNSQQRSPQSSSKSGKLKSLYSSTESPDSVASYSSRRSHHETTPSYAAKKSNDLMNESESSVSSQYSGRSSSRQRSSGVPSYAAKKSPQQQYESPKSVSSSHSKRSNHSLSEKAPSYSSKKASNSPQQNMSESSYSRKSSHHSHESPKSVSSTNSKRSNRSNKSHQSTQEMNSDASASSRKSREQLKTFSSSSDDNELKSPLSSENEKVEQKKQTSSRHSNNGSQTIKVEEEEEELNQPKFTLKSVEEEEECNYSSQTSKKSNKAAQEVAKEEEDEEDNYSSQASKKSNKVVQEVAKEEEEEEEFIPTNIVYKMKEEEDSNTNIPVPMSLSESESFEPQFEMKKPSASPSSEAKTFSSSSARFIEEDDLEEAPVVDIKQKSNPSASSHVTFSSSMPSYSQKSGSYNYSTASSGTELKILNDRITQLEAQENQHSTSEESLSDSLDASDVLKAISDIKMKCNAVDGSLLSSCNGCSVGDKTSQSLKMEADLLDEAVTSSSD